MPKRSQYNSQSGNVLFLILIAVVLFAALSYAVTSSTGSGGNKDTTEDKAKLYVSEIAQFTTAIRTAITLLTATSKCVDTELSFEGPPFDGSDVDYVNPNSPNDFSCHIFHPDGGGVSWRAPDDKWLKGTTLAKWEKQFIFSGNDCVPNVGTGAGSGCWNNGTNEDTELNMYLVDVTDTLCLELNRNGATVIQEDSGGNFFHYSHAAAKFKGSYGINATQSRPINTPTVSGRYFHCFYDSTAATNIHFEVLLAR